MRRIPEEDLLHILKHTETIWDAFKNKSIFITGATGFFGKWLLESFIFINNKLSLNASICALSRNPEAFLEEYPFYKDEPAIRFIKGDIKNFVFPEGVFQFVIHAATDTDAKINAENPLLMLDTITEGTKRVLNFAKNQPIEAFLLTSSGAIYGKQPENITHIDEFDSFKIELNNPNSAYAEGKRIAELYCSIYYKQFSIPVKIARCFAFVGPYLPLDKHFAIGNFILNGLNNEDIIIKGDGTPYRSYLYASDLTVWLWIILLNGKSNIPYNVGSDEDYSIEQLAGLVNKVNKSNKKVLTLKSKELGKPVERYVPSVQLAQIELGLHPIINLEEAILKTLNFIS